MPFLFASSLEVSVVQLALEPLLGFSGIGLLLLSADVTCSAYLGRELGNDGKRLGRKINIKTLMAMLTRPSHSAVHTPKVLLLKRNGSADFCMD